MRNPKNNPCPLLPQIEGALPITHTKKHREACGLDFYLACLELAQHLWMIGLPAQSMLQVNRSFMAQLPANHPITSDYPIGYRVMGWIIENTKADKSFLGNPVRHFQHLASRMNFKQPQPELRVWRAWCCFHVAEAVLDPVSFPRDNVQIERECLEIPDITRSMEMLGKFTPHEHEIGEVKKLLL